MRNIESIPHRPAADHLLTPSLGAVALGLALLLLGRRLFWLFVGGLGFVLANEFIAPLIAGDDAGLALIVSVVAGLAGAVLAIFLQKFAIGLAGALAGAYYLNMLLAASALHDPRAAWISVLIGAVVGAVLLLYLFKWALIFFSSIVGAQLIVHALQAFQVSAGLRGAVFLALMLFGIAFQGGWTQRSKRVEG